MNPLLWNLIFGLIWMALSSDYSPRGFIVGLALGFVVVALVGPAMGVRGYGKRLVATAGFLVFYMGDLVMSNLRVARDVLRPKSQYRPGFIAIPVADLSAQQITLLANLITMTPGTLSIDVSTDNRTLYIHSMFVDDPEDVRRNIQRGLIRLVKEVIH